MSDRSMPRLSLPAVCSWIPSASPKPSKVPPTGRVTAGALLGMSVCCNACSSRDRGRRDGGECGRRVNGPAAVVTQRAGRRRIPLASSDAGPDGPDLVARVFGPGVERAMVDTAAHVLQRMAGTRFPAERCTSDDPVLALGEDRHVLITEYVEPSPAPGPGFVLAWCAGLLGRLAIRSAKDLPAGGGWHRLGPTPSREIDQALALGGHVGPSVAELSTPWPTPTTAPGCPRR